MPKLIDADKLKEHYAWWDNEDKKIFDTIVDLQPDAVVRCKDCINSCPFTEEELKYPYRVGEWHCEFWFAEMHEDDYCSCGKRRKDEAFCSEGERKEDETD